MSWIKRQVTARLFDAVRGALPHLSETERQALEAGDVWWDAEILSGKPDWARLEAVAGVQFTEAEQAFLDGPVEQLCEMIDDWAITFEYRRLPVEIWDFIKKERFLGMILPREYGGLGFSAAAHSEVITRISTRSISVAVTVMVPNSLGPGELLLHYGTEEQKDRLLPRLADGTEVPAFALTSPVAGSDAAGLQDRGVVCYQEVDGEQVLGLRLNWEKRYITLGPVSTLLGLAFRLYDPDHILGDDEDRGITLALIPTDTPGVEIGRRHYASFQAFQNGPNEGHDVFVPMDAIIGGEAQIGNGWQMLMAALSAGRSISLPSMSAGGAKLSALTSGNYSLVRQQFGLPIGKFEGIQARLARVASAAYLLDAARITTTLALDEGYNPSVVSAILKSQSTFRMRQAVTDAMDIHGGKAICEGPLNYLGNVWRAIPVAITVEGANILTRNLIIFGQGAVRCHPYLLEEIMAAENEDREAGLDSFHARIYRHLGHTFITTFRSLFHGLTGGRLAHQPRGAGPAAKYYRLISRYSASLAFATEVALISLGAELKRKEMISARLGDVLGELYLLSCVLKRFSWEGRPKEDLPLVQWCCLTGFKRIEEAFDQVCRNYPSRPLSWLLRAFIIPLGLTRHEPPDDLSKQCAELLMSPSATRDRLTAGVYRGSGDDGMARLETAFRLVLESRPVQDKLEAEKCEDVDTAMSSGIITESEAELLRRTAEAVDAAIEVDAFDAEVLEGGGA